MASLWIAMVKQSFLRSKTLIFGKSYFPFFCDFCPVGKGKWDNASAVSQLLLSINVSLEKQNID